MNEGPDFQPRADDDDAHDPLLGALRQRLGESFGQEPSPELWASIRQQLPAAGPRAWWLRSRRLLALLVLLGGVLLGGTALWITGSQPAANPPVHRPATNLTVTNSAANSAATSPAATSPAATPGPTAATSHIAPSLPVPPAGSPTHSSTSPASRAAAQSLAATTAPRATAGGPESVGSQPFGAHVATPPSSAAKALGPAAGTPPHSHSAAPRAMHTLPGASGAGRYQQHHAAKPAEVTPASEQQRAASLAAQTPATQPVSSPSAAAGAPSAAPNQAAAADATRPLVATSALTRSTRQKARHAAQARHQVAGVAVAEALTATTSRARRVGRWLAGPRAAYATQEVAPVAAGDGPTTDAALAAPAALDSLGGRRAGLLLAALALPAPLAPRPDSAGPWLPPARRWSVLVLAGPTISYRTTGQVLSTPLAYAPAPTNSANLAGRGTSAASLAELEQPAAGLGVQVQVRRVLTGRWALALGAGYQEYATRLVGQATLTRSAYSAAMPDSSYTLNHRETYRFLTLPVQLSYALSPPRGRFSLGVLGGLEPSWYQGGSATVLSGSVARSTLYSSVAGSPFNAFNLAVSLGLDARLRLGGPAGRWQLVAQPTARYLATPFVRGNAAGYAARQPYSLGLLTGFAWLLP